MEYVAPPAADAPALRLIVQDNDGDDRVTVNRTAATVPVRVEGGRGRDIVTVGGGCDALTDIDAVSRPGLDAPFGLGPLVVVGSPRDDHGN